MSTLEAPQDTLGQDTGQGPLEWKGQTEAKVELGALEAMAGGPCSHGLGLATTARALLPLPKKNSMGQLGVFGTLRG